MQETLDAKYSVILKKYIVDDVMVTHDKELNYKNFSTDSDYYESRHTSKEVEELKSALINKQKNIVTRLREDKSFVIAAKGHGSQNKTFVFIPILDDHKLSTMILKLLINK